jgi:PAS domain S-box-containing protein
VLKRVAAGYAALMALLSAAVFVAPEWSAFTWAVIGLLSAGAVVFGAWWHAPLRRAPWWLLAGAILAMAAGDTIYGATVHSAADELPIIGEICYLAMFPLVTAGLIQMTRTSVVLRDRARLLDILTFTCAAALMTWVFLASPSLGAAGLDNLDKSTMSAYTLGDLLILITTVRLLVAARRSVAVVLLMIGAGGGLVSDVAYTLSQLGSGWQSGGPWESGYLLLYICWGASALHPSMTELTLPVDTGSTILRRRSMILLLLSVAVPPAILIADSLLGRDHNKIVIAVVALLISAFVITRLADAITRHQQAVARERSLRRACGDLVAATEPASVDAIVRAAVATLMPAGVPHSLVFAVADTQHVYFPLPAASGARRTRLLSARTLHPTLRDELEPHPATLVCPLVRDHRGEGDPGIGTLFVAADERVLATMRDAVEVLAAQATLALERIALTEAVARRDSDEYMRAVVQNTTDVVLIVDDDDRIRYASPSLAAVLGAEPPPFATLPDIIDADDYPQVAHTLTMAQEAADQDGVADRWSLLRVDDTRVLVDVNCRDLRQDRMVRGFVITMRNVTEWHPDEQELIQRALRASPGGKNRRSSADKFR